VLDKDAGLLGCDTVVGLLNCNVLKECNVGPVFSELRGLL